MKEKTKIVKEWTVGREVFGLVRTNDDYCRYCLVVRRTDAMGSHYWDYTHNGYPEDFALALAKKDAGVL